MSSFQLPLSITQADAPSPQSRLPVHVSFSPTKDLLASLWETGYVELTDLRTRIGPGRGKVMDPLPLWKGTIGAGTNEYRQVIVLQSAEDTERIAVLGSGKSQDAKDVVNVLYIKGGSVAERFEVDMPQRNGRLVPSGEHVWWQSPEGEILAGLCYFRASRSSRCLFASVGS